MDSKYLRLKEDEYIKQAEERGYFLHLTRRFIEDNLIPEDTSKLKKRTSVLDDPENEKKDLSRVRLVKLDHVRLRNIGDLGMCFRLSICILSNNYIAHFEGLAPCVNLIKLDLHSNQISSVPLRDFWSRMQKLKTVLLHDNPIGAIENLHHMAHCPGLEILTLFDTPLSLKRNYRHHVVNSIWSLKALDHYAISDEEIIEDTELTGKFSPLNSNFRVDLCPPMPEDSTFKEELICAHQVAAEVNRVLAHFSPVMIIQRWVRGYFLRKRLQLVQEYKIWATLTIKQHLKKLSALEGTDPSMAPPPPSPLTREPSVFPASDATRQVVTDKFKLDYDTYLRNRRPGSTVFSEVSSLQPPGFNTTASHVDSSPLTLDSSRMADFSQRRSLFINLAKLQTSTIENLQEAAAETSLPTEVVFSSREDRAFQEMMKARKPLKKEKERDKKKYKVKDVRQFFGPVVDVHPEVEEEEEEIPKIGFRLKGILQDVVYYDPVTDMVISKREAGLQVRAAEDEYHNRKNLLSKTKTVKHDVPSAHARMIGKMQRDMGLSCLKAVHKAYEERNKAEKQAAKMEFVMRMKEDRENAKERIRMYNDERRLKSLKDRESDRRSMLDYIENRDVQHMKYINRKKDVRLKSSQQQRSRRGEMTFMKDFNAQNTSVSNALLRHDRQARKEDSQVEKLGKIQSYKMLEGEQQSMVKTYLEHRQLMRQTETAMSRAAIDAKMLQDANDRLMAARSRVAQQKARSAQVKASYAVPIVSNQPMTAQENTLIRWNASAVN